MAFLFQTCSFCLGAETHGVFRSDATGSYLSMESSVCTLHPFSLVTLISESIVWM